jgi:hypothetical protein
MKLIRAVPNRNSCALSLLAQLFLLLGSLGCFYLGLVLLLEKRFSLGLGELLRRRIR